MARLLGASLGHGSQAAGGAALAAAVGARGAVRGRGPELPCSFPGGDSCPPADEATTSCPPTRSPTCTPTSTRTPSSTRRRCARRPRAGARRPARRPRGGAGSGGAGAAGRVRRRDRPWFGGEAALAVLGGRGRPQRVVLLEVADADGAAAFADRLATGAPGAATTAASASASTGGGWRPRGRRLPRDRVEDGRPRGDRRRHRRGAARSPAPTPRPRSATSCPRTASPRPICRAGRRAADRPRARPLGTLAPLSSPAPAAAPRRR